MDAVVLVPPTSTEAVTNMQEKLKYMAAERRHWVAFESTGNSANMFTTLSSQVTKAIVGEIAGSLCLHRHAAAATQGRADQPALNNTPSKHQVTGTGSSPGARRLRAR